MKIADFQETVTTVPFTLTIVNLNIILGKNVALIIFADFEQSLVVDTVLATNRFLYKSGVLKNSAKCQHHVQILLSIYFSRSLAKVLICFSLFAGIARTLISCSRNKRVNAMPRTTFPLTLKQSVTETNLSY